MSWGREMCDDFDFHGRSLRQRRNLDCRTGRERLRKIPGVDRVHLREITQIRHEYGRLDNIAESQPLIAQNNLNILQNPFRLNFDPSRNQGAICRIERNLPACKEEISDPHGDTIWTDCSGSSLRRNGLWTHTYADSLPPNRRRKTIEFQLQMTVGPPVAWQQPDSRNRLTWRLAGLGFLHSGSPSGARGMRELPRW